MLKTKVSIKDLYVSGPSEMWNNGKCVFTLTKKSKFAGVIFRMAGVEVNEETGQLMLKYEILYCPKKVKITKGLSQEIGLVLDDVASMAKPAV